MTCKDCGCEYDVFELDCPRCNLQAERHGSVGIQRPEFAVELVKIELQASGPASMRRIAAYLAEQHPDVTRGSALIVAQQIVADMLADGLIEVSDTHDGVDYFDWCN